MIVTGPVKKSSPWRTIFIITFVLCVGIISAINSINPTLSPVDASYGEKQVSAKDHTAPRVDNLDYADQYIPTYSYPRFNSTNITFSYNVSCIGQIEALLDKSFRTISEDTDGALSFTRVEPFGKGHINIECSSKKQSTQLGIGGPVEYYPDTNQIVKAEAIIYNVKGGSYSDACGTEFPSVIIHEILHTLGLEHASEGTKNDIMSSKTGHSYCSRTIATKYRECLKALYLEEDTTSACSKVNFFDLSYI